MHLSMKIYILTRILITPVYINAKKGTWLYFEVVIQNDRTSKVYVAGY